MEGAIPKIAEEWHRRPASTIVDEQGRARYAVKQQGVPQPRVAPEGVRDHLAHLAVHQQVSASTQNQAFRAILFPCREMLGVNVEGLSPGVRAKRGERLPVVLSMPETMALLSAMSGTPRLMATLIYGGGLRVTARARRD
ncbi:MAG: integron integrase, partial [Acidobacteria bacterium]|nr:integron integrase [Acidobacteriota bacterium]